MTKNRFKYKKYLMHHVTEKERKLWYSVIELFKDEPDFHHTFSKWAIDKIVSTKILIKDYEIVKGEFSVPISSIPVGFEELVKDKFFPIEGRGLHANIRGFLTDEAKKDIRAFKSKKYREAIKRGK